MADKRNKDIAEVYRLVHNLYALHFPEQDNFKLRDSLFCAIVEFDVIFPNGIKDMLAYIEWENNHFESQITTARILSTCMHDINGWNETGFSPRSSGYSERIENEKV